MNARQSVYSVVSIGLVAFSHWSSMDALLGTSEASKSLRLWISCSSSFTWKYFAMGGVLSAEVLKLCVCQRGLEFTFAQLSEQIPPRGILRSFS